MKIISRKKPEFEVATLGRLEFRETLSGCKMADTLKSTKDSLFFSKWVFKLSYTC